MYIYIYIYILLEQGPVPLQYHSREQGPVGPIQEPWSDHPPPPIYIHIYVCIYINKYIGI
jgi:hypothetical protein